jgi:hypothetical protein
MSQPVGDIEGDHRIRTLLTVTKGSELQANGTGGLGHGNLFYMPCFSWLQHQLENPLSIDDESQIKWMNQRDICDQISRRHQLVGGTGYIEASHAGNNVTAARGIVICTRNSTGYGLGGQPSLGGQPG